MGLQLKVWINIAKDIRTELMIVCHKFVPSMLPKECGDEDEEPKDFEGMSQDLVVRFDPPLSTQLVQDQVPLVLNPNDILVAQPLTELVGLKFFSNYSSEFPPSMV